MLFTAVIRLPGCCNFNSTLMQDLAGKAGRLQEGTGYRVKICDQGTGSLTWKTYNADAAIPGVFVPIFLFDASA